MVTILIIIGQVTFQKLCFGDNMTFFFARCPYGYRGPTCSIKVPEDQICNYIQCAHGEECRLDYNKRPYCLCDATKYTGILLLYWMSRGFG